MPGTAPAEILVCESAAMRELVRAIERIAPLDGPVLIVGEPGTGRELVARLIHELGPQRRGALVTVRAGAALANGLQGIADAFSRARLGSVLIKDVGELSRAAQRRLARILSAASTGQAGGRVLCTAEPGLDRAAAAEMWHRGLYERLAATTLVVPALRDRQDDVAPLAARFLRQYCRELGRPRLSVGPGGMSRLKAHRWPGNAAELKAITRRLAIGVRGRTASAADVDATLPPPPPLAIDQVPLEELIRTRLASFLERIGTYVVTGVHEEIMTQVERPLIALVLEHAGGNQVRAAEMLGLSRNTLRKKLSDHGLAGSERARLPARRAR
jgi:two-component system nitrogen regulation response regulator GlnG